MGWIRSGMVSLLAATLTLGLVAVGQVWMDPLGVWGGTPVAGLNQAKPQQKGVERVFKPYQVADRCPEVLFLGSSRVSYGMPPEWPGVKDERVYNFGFNASRVDEMVRAGDLAFDLCPPKVVVFGVGVTEFEQPKRPGLPLELGYDPSRDFALRWGLGLLWRLRDSVFSIDSLWGSYDAYQESEKRPGQVYYRHGYRQQRGEYKGLIRKLWISRTRHYFRTYHTMEPQQAKRELVADALDRWERAGAEVHLVHLPDYADLVTAWYRGRQRGRLEAHKRALAKRRPFLDCFQIDASTSDPSSFTDAAHMTGDFGRAIVKQLNGAPGTCHSVNAANVSQVLEDQFQAVRAWKKRHPGLEQLHKLRRDEAAFKKGLRKLHPFLK